MLYWVFLLSLVSGAISLGYQVMWFRLYADRLGSTQFTFLLVLIAFIGGLGAGSLASRSLSTGLARMPWFKDPLRQIGLIEIGIALFAFLTFVIHPASFGHGGDFPYRLDSRGIYEPVLALRLSTGWTALLLFLPTVLMGTTFPILCHAFRARCTFPSELYGWNTLGACLGVLMAEFVLLRVWGHSVSFVVLLVANVCLGLAFMAISRMLGSHVKELDEPGGRIVQGQPRSEKRGSTSESLPLLPSLVFTVAVMCGFCAGALEVDMFRAVRFAGAITDAAMSFTSFWAIAAIFTASWVVRALQRPRHWLLRVAILGSALVYASTWIGLANIRGWFNELYMAHVAAKAHLVPSVMHATVYPLSASLPLLLGFTGVVVFPAYFLASLLLPTICNAVQGSKQHLGKAYGLNTLAFCAGAVAFSWAAPMVNMFYAVKLLFAMLGAAAFLALTFRAGKPLPRLPVALTVVAICAAVWLVPRGFDRRFFPAYEMPARYPVRAMKSNGSQTTYIVAQPDGDYLYFDSHPMSGTSLSAQMYMSLMAHVPLLAHPAPKDVLLICFGVGNTARAIAAHEEMQSLDIVDLNDKVFETADEFARTNDMAHRDPRVRLIHDDGRAFLERTDKQYDLITSEPPPPREAGVYRLYSVEYYRSVLAHLTPQGFMTQWLPVNVLSGTAVDRIISSFVNVFPHTLLLVGTGDQLILMGGPQPFDAALLERRFKASPGARKDLADLGIVEPVQLLARVIRMDDALVADVKGVPVTSDQRNDLALAVTDPFDPPRILIDPQRVLHSLVTDQLECGPRLTRTLTDPKQLWSVVPDYYRSQVTR